MQLSFNFKGDIDEVTEGLNEMATAFGFVLSDDGMEVIAVKSVDGLWAGEKDGRFQIVYRDKPEFFRGLSVLLHYATNQKSGFFISEKRHFESCGVMVDVSRNAVLKVETVKDIIRRIARMGLNMMMLYTEDVYKMDKYPYFGYMRGAYTKEELKEMDAYADIFGIEMIPCIQTLGHLYRALRWPYSADITDLPGILMIDEPKTYEFIEEMIKTMSECFKSRKIHVGMDETFGVGFGKYFNKFGYVDKFELLSRHLGRVVETSRKYGMEPMMWSDMFFRLSSETNTYCDVNAKLPDNITELIPEDTTMVFWAYSFDDKQMYSNMLKQHRKMERPVMFAGGVWTWNGVSITYDRTFKSSHPALQVCREENVSGVLATMWGDDGAETSVYTALLGVQLFAEYNYHEKVDDKHLAEMFKICTGYDMESFLALDIDHFDEETGIVHVSISKQVLYQDVLQGLFDKNFELIDLGKHYSDILKKLKNLPKQADLEYLFEYQIQLVKTLEQKWDIGIRLTGAYADKNMDEMKKIAQELKKLKENIGLVHTMLTDIWYKNNKAFGLDRLDLRFGGVLARIDRAISQIKLFLEGKINNIEELEEERLYYGETKTPFVREFRADRFMSV